MDPPLNTRKFALYRCNCLEIFSQLFYSYINICTVQFNYNIIVIRFTNNNNCMIFHHKYIFAHISYEMEILDRILYINIYPKQNIIHMYNVHHIHNYTSV